MRKENIHLWIGSCKVLTQQRDLEYVSPTWLTILPLFLSHLHEKACCRSLLLSRLPLIDSFVRFEKPSIHSIWSHKCFKDNKGKHLFKTSLSSKINKAFFDQQSSKTFLGLTPLAHWLWLNYFIFTLLSIYRTWSNCLRMHMLNVVFKTSKLNNY